MGMSYSTPIYVKCSMNATPLDVFHFICFGTWSLIILQRVSDPPVFHERMRW